MDETLERGGVARRLLLRRALGAGVVVVIASRAFAAAAAEAAQVTIDNFKFSPSPITVKVGETLTWVNHDDMPHSIVFPKLSVRSPAMDTDGTFAHKFEQAGTFDYLCGLHPFMHGQVVVQG